MNTQPPFYDDFAEVDWEKLTEYFKDLEAAPPDPEFLEQRAEMRSRSEQAFKIQRRDEMARVSAAGFRCKCELRPVVQQYRKRVPK